MSIASTIKITTRFDMDWDLNITHEESYMYSGDVSLCGGGGGKGGSTPEYEAPPVVAELPEPPQQADTSVREAGDLERRQRRAAMGTSSTILTGGAGLLDAASTNKKTLLGQ